MNEIWLKIDGIDDYAFSNYGRIYNYKKQEYSTGNLNKKTGYYEKLLFKDGKYFKGGGIHKFIYEAFKGKIPKGMEVNHIDGDKSNNAIWNLNLMTHSENRKWLTKKVYQYTLDGALVKVYNSALQASEEIGIPLQQIYQCTTGKLYSTKNHILSYTDDDSIIKDIIKKVKKKPIEQYTKNGEFVAEYESLREAQRMTGIDSSGISKCCLGKYKTAGGSIWKYKEVA